jgi:hypothetical protein
VGGRFSPRLLVGLSLIALVAIVVVVGRLASHGRSDQVGISAPRATVTASTPAAATSGPDVRASSDPLLHKPVPPSTPPGADPPSVVAEQFALAWLHHDGVAAQAWLDGLAPYSTADLRTQLVGVDPADVPANRLTKAVGITDDTETDCVAQATTDSGVLKLSLELTSGHWLVTNIDWDQS